MSERLPCDEIRALLFEFHRGELSDLKYAEVEEHLRDCRRCCEMADKIRDMFGAAAEGETSTWTDLEPDALFERIETAIEDEAGVGDQPDVGERLEGLFETTREADEETWAEIDSDDLFDRISRDVRNSAEGEQEAGDARETGERAAGPGADDKTDGPSRWRRASYAVAAAAVLLAVGWGMYSTLVGSASSPQTERGGSASMEADENGEAGGRTEAGPAVALPPMQPVESNHDAVRLFSDSDADLSVGTGRGDGGEDHHVVELNEGSILAEYRPGSRGSFSVRTESRTVSVTGTVFSVEARDGPPRIAVYEGSVSVTDSAGRTRRLKRGTVTVGDEDGTIDDDTRSQIERYIDLDEHRRQIREGRNAATRESETRLRAAIEAATVRMNERGAGQRGPGSSETAADRDTESGGDATSGPDGSESEEARRRDGDSERGESAGTDDEADAETARDLHATALEALRDQEPRRAAELLKQALEKTGPSDRARADILLELARLHHRQLDEPQRAVGYLDDFVDQWPDDPAADAIRRQLCEMDPEAVDEANCE